MVEALRQVAACLEALGVQHGLQVFHLYRLDVAVPREATHEKPVAILLLTPADVTSANEPVGAIVLKRRLLQSQG